MLSKVFTKIFIYVALFLVVVTSVGWMATVVFAAQNTFQVHINIIGPPDILPPTIPTGLTAVTVSTSQINLSWNASTDNVAVTGYKIFRDGVYFSTSAITSYSDSGLIPNTAYSYNVSAFDAATNESARSATSTATTSAFVVETPTLAPTGGGGDLREFFKPKVVAFYDIEIIPDYYSAIIKWKTPENTQSKIFWGKTTDYEAGSSLNSLFLKNHNIEINDLEPNTRYYFKIESVDSIGRINRLENYSFITTPIISSYKKISPSNVSNLNIKTYADRDIKITWNNPIDSDFEAVRIVVSDRFYPKDIFDGKILYEGSEENATDKAVEKEKIYYYTIFAKDKDGNYSSGAIGKGIIKKIAVSATIIEAQIPPPPPPTEEIPPISPSIQKLALKDFDFIQNGKKIQINQTKNSVEIDGTKNLKVSIDYKKLEEKLNTITITIFDPVSKKSNKQFSFLLSANEKKTVYEAIISPLVFSGPEKYNFNITIYDFKNKESKIFLSQFEVIGELSQEKISFFKNIYEIINQNIFYIILLLLLLILILIIRRFFKKS